MTSNQSSKFNKIFKDKKDACEYRINQDIIANQRTSFSYFFDFFLNYLQEQHKVHHTIKKTINTPPNLKWTLSSMFKHMYVRIKDKSFNESTREKERKHLI